jgi:hypothetical protein
MRHLADAIPFFNLRKLFESVAGSDSLQGWSALLLLGGAARLLQRSAWLLTTS